MHSISFELGSEVIKLYHDIAIQLFFLIITFNHYIRIQSLIHVTFIFISWAFVTSTITNIFVLSGGIAGIVLGKITVYVFKCTKTESLAVKIYYSTILPVILNFITPTFIDQTQFPVGIYLSLILWFGVSLISSEVVIETKDKVEWVKFLPTLIFFVFYIIFHSRHWVAIVSSFSFQFFFSAFYFFHHLNK